MTPDVQRLHPELPMFRVRHGDGAVLYAPGWAARDSAAAIELLESRAAAAQEAWNRFVARPFAPECLTLYLSNQCNLGCSYCYSAPAAPERAQWRLHPHGTAGATAFPIINEDAAAGAALVVARHCEIKGRPFSLIFHGGGEPTLHWDLLQRLRLRIGQIAADRGLSMWSYIATNGLMADARADWLAAHFTTVGLSCDGPPDLQDGQRPTASGGSTATSVERTARRLNDRGADFHVRVTITRASIARQREIVDYCGDRLFARTVRFEPAYQSRPGAPGHFAAEDAGLFVDRFLDARRAAADRGMQLQISGIRIDEIHGPYCNPLRDVLQLSPDGRASACFLTADGDREDDAVLALGHYDDTSGIFVIDHARAAALRSRAARIPERCHACVNVYHCARDCPDTCVITADSSARDGGFRCRVQKLLAHELIREMAHSEVLSAV